MGIVAENNQVTVSGEISSNFKFSHEVCGEKFYVADLKVRRLSDACDIIPIMVSDYLLDVNNDYTGCNVIVAGQYRSFNKHEEGKNHLILSVFANEVELMDSVVDDSDTNQIYLDGYICKEPIYRKTTSGREIADLLLAVNRTYGKSDYIPCICWGRNARYASNLNTGEHLRLHGRIQSRVYYKPISETVTEERVAYEVSASRLEALREEN